MISKPDCGYIPWLCWCSHSFSFYLRQAANIPEFKLLLVGAGGVGKKTFLERHRTGEFDMMRAAALGADVHPLQFSTNCGPIKFNVWPMPGSEIFGGAHNEYFAQADCAIVMFDHASSINTTMSLTGTMS
jgi:GTP-binding nuclear protein Ran